MAAIATAQLLCTDVATGYMHPHSARRYLLDFLNYANESCVSQCSTLKIICYEGCRTRDLRFMLAPFGVSLKADGSGEGESPAGKVICVLGGAGGPRPILTMWKVAKVESSVLSGVLQDRESLFRILPVAVFHDVLWPLIRDVARSAENIGSGNVTSDEDKEMGEVEEDEDSSDGELEADNQELEENGDSDSESGNEVDDAMDEDIDSEAAEGRD